jgi:hypothetical protein
VPENDQAIALLREIRDQQKAQFDLLQAWQASISAQHEEYMEEKKKWLAEREKIRQDHLISQSRQVRGRQVVRLYMLGLFLIVAIIWCSKFFSG